MLKREFNSDKHTRPRRKPNSAETSRCMEHADTVTLAHMPMERTSSKRRPIFQATSWLNYAINSTRKGHVPTVRDANISTHTTISKPSSHTFKHWRKELDLLNWETNRSVEKTSPVPIAFGPTWRPQMDVVLQRSQDLQFSNKSTPRKTTTQNSTKRTIWKDQTPNPQSDTTAPIFQALKISAATNNHNQWTTTSTTTTSTIIITWTTTWDTNPIICRATTSTKTTRAIKCIIIIIHNKIIINNIITVGNKPMSLNHPVTMSTKVSRRFGLELIQSVSIIVY